MTLEQKKTVFVDLGRFLNQFKLSGNTKDFSVPNTDLFFDDFVDLIALSQSHNGWFTPEYVYFAIESWSKALTEVQLNQWLNPYQLKSTSTKRIGLILAGNIPLVGFHDFMSVILTNNTALIKTSSNDQHLLPFLIKYMISLNPDLADTIIFVEGKMIGFDAVIATGSTNTSRYFEYYFKDKPSIIRKNRNSVAVLTGNETAEQLTALGNDLFTYFGLGCRSVSKIFVPKGYNFDAFFTGIFSFQDIIHYEKYANNYDYNKAVYLMSNYKLLDNGFIVLKEDSKQYASPISSICYEYYEDIETLNLKLTQDTELLQCIVGDKSVVNSIPFGETQKPKLNDYADGIDTITFLTSIR